MSDSGAEGATYHGIARVKCLGCGYETSEVYAMEAWNDLGVACLADACEDGRTEWESINGSVVHTALDGNGHLLSHVTVREAIGAT